MESEYYNNSNSTSTQSNVSGLQHIHTILVMEPNLRKIGLEVSILMEDCSSFKIDVPDCRKMNWSNIHVLCTTYMAFAGPTTTPKYIYELVLVNSDGHPMENVYIGHKTRALFDTIDDVILELKKIAFMANYHNSNDYYIASVDSVQNGITCSVTTLKDSDDQEDADE